MTSASVVRLLTERGWTIAVAESLTGGMLIAELIAPPGASSVVVGGVVAYDTRLKHSILGVDADILAERGAVSANVAERMADGVRRACAIDGTPTHVGIATTGVAGPSMQDGQPVGTVHLGFAIGERVCSQRLTLSGDRGEIRRAAALETLVRLERLLS